MPNKKTESITLTADFGGLFIKEALYVLYTSAMFGFSYDDFLQMSGLKTLSRSDLVAGKSTIDRNGVFAGREFKKGDAVYTLTGKEIDIPSIERIYLNGLTRISTDGFQLSDERYMFLDTFSGYINHSCNPTCGVVKNGNLIALHDIHIGDEITYDYSSVEWTPLEYRAYDPREWPMVCRCGQSECRRLVTCFPCLPDVVRQKYIDAGMIPDHIKAKLLLPYEKTRCRTCEHIVLLRAQEAPHAV